MSIKRELLITKDVQYFLDKFGNSEYGKELNSDIYRAIEGFDTKDDCIRFTGGTFLLLIINPISPGAPERVIVWHGPSDGGIFYSDSILKRVYPWKISVS